jgi:hypothetical protein
MGINQLESEADHLLPSIAKVKECVELYLHSPIYLHGMVLRQRDNFNFLLLHATQMGNTGTTKSILSKGAQSAKQNYRNMMHIKIDICVVTTTITTSTC